MDLYTNGDFLKIFLCLYASISYNLPSMKTIWIRVKASSYYMIMVLRPSGKYISPKHIYGDVLESRWRAKCDHARSSPCSHQQYIRRAQILKWQPIKKCWKIQLNFYAALTFEDNFWKYMHIIMVLVIIIFQGRSYVRLE